MRKIYSSILSVILLLSLASGIFADVKIRQRLTMSGQSFETTKMIRGARQRTEQKSEMGGGAADYMSQVATIEQCDLRRTVQLNDRKKLYFIEPFADSSETSNDASIQTPKSKTQNQKGGITTITYIVTDTGERQTLFGLTARHLKIVQEMESSPDSCNGANKSKMEIDGWYVDFSAEFNCPVDIPQTLRSPMNKPDCQDRIVFKGSRTAKTGFLLNGTTRFYDENGNVTVSQTTETLELSRSPLAASLFDVPADYRLAASPDELYTMPDMKDLMRRQNDEEQAPTMSSNRGQKNVGLNIIFGSDVKVNQEEINRYLQNELRSRNYSTRGGGGSDYVLNVEIRKAKETKAGKIGGVFGKVTGVGIKDQTEVELVMTLAKGGTDAQLGQTRINRKYEGAVSEALHAAIDEALDKILVKIQN